jgi:hypothetical protein
LAHQKWPKVLQNQHDSGRRAETVDVTMSIQFYCLDCRAVAPLRQRCAACGGGVFRPTDRIARPIMRVVLRAPMQLLAATLSVLQRHPPRHAANQNHLSDDRARLRHLRGVAAASRDMVAASRALADDAWRLLRRIP